jgi:hypothetical protein
MNKDHERIDPHYAHVIRQLVKQVGVDHLRLAIAQMYDTAAVNDIPTFTKIRTIDLSTMTDLLTDAYMAFEDITKDDEIGVARTRALSMVKELRNWRPADEKE